MSMATGGGLFLLNSHWSHCTPRLCAEQEWRAKNGVSVFETDNKKIEKRLRLRKSLCGKVNFD